jgi:hypothetical protein
VLVRIGAEVAEDDVFFAGRRNFQIAGLPEGVEVRQRRGVGAGAVAAVLVKMTEPGILVAALCVGLGDAEALRQSAEDVEVIARLADRRDSLRHRHDEFVAPRATDVVALKRSGRRQHDVGMPRGRSPPGLVHHDGVGFRPGAAELVGVLVMMKRIAAGPVDQFDVGIGAALAVEIVRRARVAAGNRRCAPPDGDVDRILDASIAGAANDSGGIADAGAGAIAESEAAARQADLAEREASSTTAQYGCSQ